MVLLLPARGETCRCLPTKAAVSPLVIVFVSPVTEKYLGLEEAVELLAVQELVAQSSVERLDLGVLPG